MEQFLIYLLKSSGITALFLLFYLLVIKEETFFKVNRIFLLTGLGISILLPFMIITKTIWLQPVPINPSNSANHTLAPLENGINFDWLSLPFYVYIAGTFLLAIRFVLQLLSLNRLISKSIKFREGKFCIVETDQKVSPFTFFRYVVYNPNLHTPSELKTILAHEKIHAERKHSVDLMVMHLLIFFNGSTRSFGGTGPV